MDIVILTDQLPKTEPLPKAKDHPVCMAGCSFYQWFLFAVHAPGGMLILPNGIHTLISIAVLVAMFAAEV